MDFLLVESKRVINGLSIKERAEMGLLDDELSIKEIAELWCKDDMKLLRYITALVDLCKAGKIKYRGNINGWVWGGNEFNYIENPHKGTKGVLVDMGDPMRTAVCNRWRSGPADCLISKDGFEAYLKNAGQWPLKSGLIATWFNYRRKRKPAEKRRSGASESLMLIDAILDSRGIHYFDDLKEGEIWEIVVSGRFESDLIKKLPEHNNDVLVMSSGEKIKRVEFLKKYSERFEK